MKMLIYGRTQWQVLEWIRSHTGLEKFVVNMQSMTVNLNADVRIYIVTPDQNVHNFAGLAINLVFFLIDPPIEDRNYLLSLQRWPS